MLVSTSQYSARGRVLAGGESGRSPSGTVCNPARPVADITSCGAALEPNRCGRQSAQSGSDYHQAAGRVAMGNAALVSSGQRRHLSPDRGQHCARPLLCPYPLASGLHERAAYLYDRSVLRRCLRRLVGQQRRRLRPRFAWRRPPAALCTAWLELRITTGSSAARMSRQSSRSAVSVQSTLRSPIHRNPPGGRCDRRLPARP
jgi:hypothetical protein